MPNRFEINDAASNKATNYRLELGDILQGNLSSAGDQDWYGVQLTAGETYVFALVGTGVNIVDNPTLHLRDANGALIALNKDGLNSQNSIINFTATQSGTYYLAASGDAGQYGITAQTGTRPSFDLDMGAGMLETGASWSPARGSAVEVTYAFRDGPPTYEGEAYETFYKVTTDQMEGVQRALQFWSEVANIAFKQVNPGGYSDDATIVFANYDGPVGDPAGAFAFYPGNTASDSIDGDVWLNTDSVSTGKWAPGDYSFFVALHEIGHALGLSHPGQYNAGDSEVLNYLNNAEFVEDTAQYTIMSYFNEENTGATSYSSFADTPMVLDILALQNLYGANFSTRSGNTTYGYNSTAGAVYDLDKNPTQGFSIWDGGGFDTLDVSKSTKDNIIDLTPGSFSSINGKTNGIAIADGAWIEAVNGSFMIDIVYGNDRDNSVFGGDGNDQLFGHGGHDVLIGSIGNDVVAGNQGNDRLLGGAGLNVVLGDAGNDTIVLANSGETVHAMGGAGIDVLDLRFLVGATSWNLATNEWNFAVESTFVGIEGALFNDIANRFTGDANRNSVSGGMGIDTLSGGIGSDILNGEDDGDVLSGDGGSDKLSGGAGNDTMNGGSDDDSMTGGLNNDAISGDSGHDVIQGEGGNDTIDGGSEHDKITGGFTKGTDGSANSVNGGDGNDTLTGGGGLDTVSGGKGNDRLVWDGADALDGGDGFDLLDLSADTVGRTIDLFFQTASMANTTIANIEGVLAGSGADALEGDDEADRFDGGGGDDVINGYEGNDTIAGGLGSDTIFGAALNYGEGSINADSINGGDGADSISGNLGADTIVGGTGNDTIQADQAGFLAETASHLLTGDIGNDSIQGASGTDSLFGDENNDTIKGGAGDDTADGGFGKDRIEGEVGDDSLFGNDDNDTAFGGFGNDTVSGGFGNDRIEGGDDDDTLYGDDGNDTVFGGIGNDTIFGGFPNAGEGAPNADRLDGGTGNDSISGSLGADTIFGGEGNDTIEADLEGFYDETFSQQFFGDGGDDVIVGASGKDQIAGGVGKDIMTGKGERDTFVFKSTAEGGIAAALRDRITDFDAAGVDRIDLATIDADATDPDNDMFTFISTASFTGTGQVRFFLSSGNTYVDINTQGSIVPEMRIELAGTMALDGTDFIL